MPDGRSRSGGRFARSMLRAVLAALVVSALAVVGPASAAPEAGGEVPGASVLEEPLRGEYLAVNDRVAELREAVGSSSGRAALAALIEADGSTGAVDGTAGTGVLPEGLRAAVLEGVVTPELGVAIGDLYRTVRQADRMLGEAGAPDLASLRERLEADHSTVGGPAAVAADADGGEPDPAAREAALLVASTLDRVLPVLRSVGPLGRAGTTVSGCDLVEQVPFLCVGSDADNVYDDDVALLVDLGGDDTYLNSAGGAPFLGESGALVNVSVNVDVGGDDTYAGFAREIFGIGPDQRASVGQGAAFGLGVGILVDAAGDDQYVATPPAPTLARPYASTLVQGSAASNGVGALLDLHGDDDYRAVGPDGDQGNLFAQGAAFTQGTALLLDAGAGDDHYEVDGGTIVDSSGSADAPTVLLVHAQGAGQLFATGVLSDDGGADAFAARVAARNDRVEDDAATDVEIPRARVQAQGFGHQGTGYLFAGVGPTEYRVDAEGVGKARVRSFGQGAGQGSKFPGVTRGGGILDDAGGDDSYRLVAAQTLEREIVVDDACDCDAAVAEVEGPDGAEVAGQGAGLFVGMGLLRDGGGDDTYATVSEQRVDVSLIDGLTQPSGPARLTVTGFGSQDPIVAQGGGQGATGVLVDVAGTDDYEVRSSNDALARVSSDPPGRAPDGRGRPPEPPLVTAYARGSGVFTSVQGAMLRSQSQAAFVDLAGTGDRIESTATSRVRTWPDSDGAFHRADLWARAHGAGGGAQFVVLGDRPTVLSSPSRPACPATLEARRGFGEWTDCPPDTSADDPNHQSFDVPLAGRLTSAGFAPGSTGVAPMLAFTPDTPSQATSDPREDPVADPTVLPVGAVLYGSDGTPLDGRTIHFTLQAECEADGSVLLAGCGLGEVWPLRWQVDAVTDDAGIARARLPLLATGLEPEATWRVAATFDGEEGLHPRHAARDLTLTE